MKQIVFYTILMVCIQCYSQNLKTLISQNSTIETLAELKLENDKSKSYAEVKELIKKKKLSLKNKDLDTLSILFKESLLNRIIPFWEGTKWTFEGHTAIPNQGTIACGYFVSTTLRHVDLRLNRYRLAQQSPINEARSLAIDKEVIEISEPSIEENIAKINSSLKEGIHFIGFDTSHVGYILKEKEQLYLIHSNYVDSKGVEIKKIESSNVFAAYNTYYLIELSTNKTLLKNWLAGIELKIISIK